MAKNIRRILAMVLVMCLFISVLPMQALAAEGDGVVTEGPVEGTTADGLTTSTTTTTTTTTTEEGKTVVVETVTNTSGTTTDGVTVTGKETTTDTTVTNTDGSTQTINAGSSEEKRESSNLSVTDVPAVNVPALPSDDVFEAEGATKDVDVQSDLDEELLGSGTYNGGKPFDVYDQHSSTVTTTTEKVTTTNQEKVEEENKTVETTTNTTINQTTVESTTEDAYEYRDRATDDVILRENVYQTTDTVVSTTTNVKVTQITTELTGDVKENDDDLVYDYTETTTTVERDVTTNTEVKVDDESTFDMDQVVAPEDYEGKKYTDAGVIIGSAMQFNGLQNSADPDKKNPSPKPSEEEDPSYKGYDYVLSGEGDSTWAAAPVFMNVVYVKNEDGTPKQDENGNYIIDEEKSQLVYAGDKAGYSGMNGTPGQIVLRNEDGEYFYTYCIDKETPTANDSWYKITNLEDSDYYPDDESAAMLRAIVTNGYWGTDANVYETDENGNVLIDENGNKITKKDENGNIIVDESVQGSLASIKSLMRDTYDEDDTVTVTDANGKEYTYTVAELIDGLQEHEALAVTQAAIWSYSNGSLAAQDGQDGVICVGVQSAKKYYNGISSANPSPLNQYAPTYDLESDARMKALYDLYMNMEPMESDPETVTTVINEQNSFKDMSFVVNDKVSEQQDGKDVYNVDLKFSLDFELNDSHDLKIRLTDAEGNNIKDADGNDIIIEKKLATSNPTDDKDTLVADENGVYTLTGLQLSEGTDFSFNLSLEGSQELQEGVYVYTSHGGQGHSQTLVGLASGTQSVDVTTTMDINFEVEEKQTVEVKHEWSNDPVVTPPEDPEDPPVDPEDPPVDPEDPPFEPDFPTFEPDFPTFEPEFPTFEPETVIVEEEPETVIVEEEPAPATYRLNNQNGTEEEIPEEPVPLAPPVITGDNSGMWLAVILMSVFAMVAINLFDKKRQHETF